MLPGTDTPPNLLTGRKVPTQFSLLLLLQNAHIPVTLGTALWSSHLPATGSHRQPEEAAEAVTLRISSSALLKKSTSPLPLWVPQKQESGGVVEGAQPCVAGASNSSSSCPEGRTLQLPQQQPTGMR